MGSADTRSTEAMSIEGGGMILFDGWNPEDWMEPKPESTAVVSIEEVKVAWKQVVESEINKLELIASWASQVNLGRVRDYCRLAQAELRIEARRVDDTKKESK